MAVHHDNIGEVILSAWNDARCAPAAPGERRDINKQRSRNWLGSLAQRFEEHYTLGLHRTFWSESDENQTEFGLNEFLFDLVVCSVSTTKSLEREPRDLEFVAQCHWLIESEFSRGNIRDIIVDMSKLVMGSAENKLLIAAHRGVRDRDVLDRCAPIAGFCGGRLYFCFVSHPDDWDKGSEALPALHEWIAGDWEEVPLPSVA